MKHSSPRPAHWSKDYAEHLRTVHFALIAVSAGLILLVVSSKQYRPSVAARQLQEISKLQSLWSVDWVRDNFVAFDPDSNHSIDIKDSIDIEQGMEQVVATAWFNTSDKHPMSYIFIIPHTWFPYSPKASHSHEWVDITQKPESLGEFERWWNVIQDDYSVVVPTKLCAKGELLARGHWSENDGKGYVTISDKAADPKVALTKVPLRLVFIGKTLIEGEKEEKKGNEGHAFRDYVTSSIGFSGDLSRQAWAFITFCGVKRIPVSQAKLWQQLDYNWRTGPFSTTFYDLSRASREFKGLKLDQVSKLLSDEASKGPEVFEAFGMKFPVGQITFWGSLILLSVQLYFLIYLKQLSGNVKFDDPGWDVPWIGMSQTALAKRVFFFTVVILPCLAISLLAWQSLVSIYRNIWDPILDSPGHQLLSWFFCLAVRILWLFASFIAAVRLAVRCWKHRPEVEPEAPSCSAQLFE